MILTKRMFRWNRLKRITDLRCLPLWIYCRDLSSSTRYHWTWPRFAEWWQSKRASYSFVLSLGWKQFTWFKLCRAMVLIGISAIMPCFSGSHIAGPMNRVMIISQQRQRISREESSPDLERIMNICEMRNDNEVGKKFIEFLKLSTNAQVNV